MASSGITAINYGRIQVQGYIVQKIQGLSHVLTDYGSYEVSNSFIATHNCLILAKVFNNLQNSLTLF